MKKKVKKAVYIQQSAEPVARKTVVPTTQELGISFAEQVQFWATNNWQKLIVIVGLICVLVVAAIVSWHVIKMNDIAAANTLTNATTIEALESAIKQYPNHRTTSPARLKLAALLIADNQFDKAAAVLKNIMDAADADFFLRGRAALDCAALYEKSDKLDEAVALYQTVSANFAYDEAQRAEGAYSAARILVKQGKIDAAKQSLMPINTARAFSEQSAYSFWAVKADALSRAIATPATAAPVAVVAPAEEKPAPAVAPTAK